MRIRKNAKISQLSSISTPPSSSSSDPFLLKTHHLQCQLNQSPWDIITFPQDDSSSSPYFQVEVGLGFAGNGSSGDSIGANQSVGSIKLASTESEEKLNNDVKWDFCDVDNGSEGVYKVGFNIEEKEEIGEVEEEHVVLCSATDGKGWQCGRVVKKGHRMCGRHWKKDIVMRGEKKSDMTKTPAARRGRGRPPIKKKEAASARNPYEFYYYSGFGVRKKAWRTMDSASACSIDDLGTSTISKDEGTAKTGMLVKCGSKTFEDEEISYMECDDEDDYDDIEAEEKSRKKSGRKRIKARSLKSLM